MNNDGNFLDSKKRRHQKNITRWLVRSTLLLILACLPLVAFTYRLKHHIARKEKECVTLRGNCSALQNVIPEPSTACSQLSCLHQFIERHRQPMNRPLIIVRSITSALLAEEKIVTLSIQKKEDLAEMVLADVDRITPFLQQLLKIPGYESAQMISFKTQPDQKVQVRFMIRISSRS